MASKKDIESMLEEKFKVQENSILKIISGNATIQNEKMDKILKSIESITKRLLLVEEKQNTLQQTVEPFRKRNCNVSNKTVYVQENLDEAKILCHELKENMRIFEDRIRIKNIRIYGLLMIINEQLQLKNIVIERAHRIGKVYNNMDTPKTVILKLLNYKDKELILKNAKKLKGKGIFINEDFSEETNKIRRNLIEKMKIARNSGKYAVLAYDKLIVKELNQNTK
ncbi:uncharacterized protein LOC124818119 [Hydra vulgaris]|uniref:uncharacterized protein LOC124818119 n=1 Tax=Hydra vulgaris TaxID=6087 RepID=UPI001F5ED8EB|nr:uncharacterized protein LOC124818119 [Hydra vulgaris]